MQRISKKYKEVNVPPVHSAVIQFVPSKEAIPAFGFIWSVDPHNCEVVNLHKYSIKGQETEFTIITKLNNGDRCASGGSQVNVQMEGMNDAIKVWDRGDGSYEVSFVPQQVGEMKLSVFVNGQQIKGSPFGVIVRDHTSVNKFSKEINSNGKIGKPWGIAFSKNDMLAVVDSSNRCVHILDGKDQLVRTIGSNGSGNIQFDSPSGIAFDNDNYLYIANTGDNHRVLKLTIDGKYMLQFGCRGSEDGELWAPAGLTVYNDKVYVSESNNKRISVFQSDGKFHNTFGSGLLRCPGGITVSANNQLVVADDSCICTFTLDGGYVRKFGVFGSGSGNLVFACGLSIDLYGFIFVSDIHTCRVTVYDKDGKFINCFGSYEMDSDQFMSPTGIAISSNGDIYVCDYSNKRILIFSCSFSYHSFGVIF